ncbi:MAG: cell envelope integrity protein TolA [Myxococcota bacterium]
MLVPRPQRTRRRWWISALVAVVLALGAHVAFFALLVFAALMGWTGGPPPQATSNKPVVLRGLSDEQWAKNRGPDAPDSRDSPRFAKKDAPKKEQKKPEEIPQGQVVDVAPGNGEVDPNARYIAETNNKAAKETRAKEQTAFYRNAMPQRTSPQKIEGSGHDDVSKAQRSGNDGLGDDDRPLRERPAKLAFEVPDVKRQQEVAIKPSVGGPGVAVANREEAEETKGNSNRLNITPGLVNPEGEEGSAGRRGTPGALNLLPSPAVLDKITGAAANDHLQDVEEGDGTFLSTREWKYASFFNRVKQSVGQQWNPVSQLRLRDPTGNVYGGRDRYTLLTITLDQQGRLKDAYVEKSSGLDFLDLEAIKAFERAQPFPNPPPGILAADATVRFQFGFFLEMSGRPGMRLFRSAD